MNQALVFTPGVELVTNQQPQEQTDCQHTEYTLTKQDGYHCLQCGIPLVFCLACMEIGMTKPYGSRANCVHAFPECDYDVTRAARKAYFGAKRQGLGG